MKFSIPIRLILVLFTCIDYIPMIAQTIISLSIFNNATALPPNGLFGPLHPGIDFGLTKLKLPLNNKSSFIQWKAGYYYHQLVHHGIQLYGEYNKVYPLIKNTLMFGWSGGLGYLHTFEVHEKFKLKSDGQYAPTGKLGKPHVQVSVAVKIIYSTKRISPFLEYRVRMSTPFVNKYVPLLPNTSLHLGFYYILETTKSSQS